VKAKDERLREALELMAEDVRQQGLQAHLRGTPEASAALYRVAAALDRAVVTLLIPGRHRRLRWPNLRRRRRGAGDELSELSLDELTAPVQPVLTDEGPWRAG
jgi:hypothetical protein